MMAAGLLEKEDSSIMIKNKRSTATFYSMEPLKIEEIEVRVEKKRELLGRLISQKEALQYWYDRNKIKLTEEKRLFFPLIFAL
jgi:hypothetical protein